MQDTSRTGTDVPQNRAPAGPGTGLPGPRPVPTGAHPALRPVGGVPPYPYGRPPAGPVPAVPGPRPAPTDSGHHHPVTGYGWSVGDLDEDDPRPEGNPAAAIACLVGLLGLLLSLRPLVFGSMAMAWDTYVALGLAVVALLAGVAGARRPVRRPVAVVGITLAVIAMGVVAVLPTL